MAIEGEVPPEVMAEYNKMKGAQTMEPKREIHFEGSKEELIGNLQAGLMKPEDFVNEVLAREGGNPRRAEATARMLKFSWLDLLEKGKMSPEHFSEGVYDKVKDSLNKKAMAEGKSEEEVAQEERVKSAFGR